VLEKIGLGNNLIEFVWTMEFVWMACSSEQNFSSPKYSGFPLNHFQLNGVTEQANANKLLRNNVECEYRTT